ncbi:MAG: carbamoyltransferase HypF [Arcobacteraceae bacterium]
MIETHIHIKGIVQGVGFRPFVYSLALKLNLKGFVNNDESGVNIVLQGAKNSLDAFIDELTTNPPSLAHIDDIKISSSKSSHTYNAFTIEQTQVKKNKTSLVSPDIAVCKECLEDISNPDNFRFNYALTNCTNCGPRYSIIKTVPYDRENTSMSSFKLCEECQKEYDNPTNRRYHAQPICCPACGPKVSLSDVNNVEIKNDLEAIKEVAQQIKHGNIVAIKSLGGFHLVCDATSSYAVNKLRQRKNRPTKPLAVMFKNLEQLSQAAMLGSREVEIITSKENPIVLVQKKENSLLAQEIAPDIDHIGVFLPFTPLQHLLFNYLDTPLVATSANLSDEPIIIKKDELYRKLSFVFEYVLDYNRAIINACDDSVVQVVNDKLFYLRKARGYAPYSLKLLNASSKKILAVGANQKNSIALYFDNTVIVSPHMGDLNSIASMEFFKNSVETFKRFYDFTPDFIVCDKHPNYETTKWAKEQKMPVVQVQHHYAHVLSCMAQYNLKQQVLAFAFDGTGYGDDGNIWGGEVFIASQKEYVRIKHFEYFKLLGGEMAIKQIKRVGLSLLFENYTLQELFVLDNPCLKAFSNKEIELLHTVWQKGLNAPLTSSAGRLFDAVCSIAGLEHNVSYEGESGLLIEQAYDKSVQDAYLYEITPHTININQAIQQMVQEKNTRLICSKFINMLSEIIVEIAKAYPNFEVVLTGGVFQNRTLLELVTQKLDAINRKYYYSKETPLNDAGIALGQIYSQLS